MASRGQRTSFTWFAALLFACAGGARPSVEVFEDRGDPAAETRDPARRGDDDVPAFPSDDSGSHQPDDPGGTPIEVASDAEAVSDAGNEDLGGEDLEGAADIRADDSGGNGQELQACSGDLETTPWSDEVDETFLRGPYLQSVARDRAVIVWRTRAVTDAPGCVAFEQADQAAEVCDDPDPLGQYEVALTGLQPGEVVTYSVQVADESSGPYQFRTAPAGLEPVRLMITADGHNNWPVLRAHALAALQAGVQIAIGVGDMVTSPEESLMDITLDALRPLLVRVPYWPVLGNHEHRGQVYFDAFVVPGAAPEPPEEIYYETTWGSLWMGMLEVIDFEVSYWMGGIETPEVAWLRERLSSAEARAARWRLLFIHEPPWCAGWGDCTPPEYHGEEALREVLLPLAVSGGVTAIFSGHMHGYEHGVSQGVHLFITGGGGGALDHFCSEPPGLPQPWTHAYVHHLLIVDAGCDELVVRAVGLDGETVDEVHVPAITREPARN